MTVRYLNEADATASDPAATPDGDAGLSTREELGRYADQGGFTITAETNPWLEAAEAVTGPEDARSASTVLAELRSLDIRAVGEAVTGIAAKAGLDVPDTLAGLKLLLTVLQRVQSTADTLRAEAYEADLEALIAATAGGWWPMLQGGKLAWGRRRELRAQARALAIGTRPRRADLHAALNQAAAARTDWAELATSESAARPVVPVDGALLTETAQAVKTLGSAVRALGLLLPERALESQPLAELADLVDRLAADEGTLYRLPALRSLRDQLAAEGLDELLAELTERQADREAALAAYDRHQGTDGGEDAARQALAAGPRVAEPETAAEDVEDVEDVEPAAADEVEAAPAAETVAAEPEAETADEAASEEPEDVELVEEPAEVLTAVEASEPEPAIETETVTENEQPEAVAVEVEVEQPEPEAEAAVEAEQPEAVADEPEPDVAVEAVAVEQPEPQVEEPEPVLEDSAEAELVAEPDVEAVAVEESAPQVQAEVEAEQPEAVEPAEAVAEEPAVAESPAEVEAPAEQPEATVEEASAAADADPAAADRPAKPEITPGRPVTAYEPAELTAVVRWIDGDGVERTDDELLRAAMKELGFARLGPRIKEALGAAVTEVRG